MKNDIPTQSQCIESSISKMQEGKLFNSKGLPVINRKHAIALGITEAIQLRKKTVAAVIEINY